LSILAQFLYNGCAGPVMPCFATQDLPPQATKAAIVWGIKATCRNQAVTWNRELFREANISFIAGGHYNTEKLGVLALGDVIRDRLDVEVEFIDLPNEV